MQGSRYKKDILNMHLHNLRNLTSKRTYHEELLII